MLTAPDSVAPALPEDLPVNSEALARDLSEAQFLFQPDPTEIYLISHNI